MDEELIGSGVVGIIGHITSSMSKAALPLVNRAWVPLISTNASALELGGKNDWFLRVCPDTSSQTKALARYAYETIEMRAVTVIAEETNQPYSDNVVEAFKTTFAALGGRIVLVTLFKGGNDGSFPSLGRRSLDAILDGLLLVGGATDTALLCQQWRKSGATQSVVSSGWAVSKDLLRNGGRAVALLPESFPSIQFRDMGREWPQKSRKLQRQPDSRSFSAASAHS